MARDKRILRRARPVNHLWYAFVSLVIRPLVRFLFHLERVNYRVIPQRGAAILVANHVNVFDPTWVYSCIERPLHLVATEELFRSTISRALVSVMGTFPIRKASGDTQAVRTMMDLLKQGQLIGLYPEGSRSWDGTNAPLIPTIARIIRRMRVPVYTCRIEGGYLHFPRWAEKWRPVPVRLVYDRLYGRGEVPDSEQQILEDIAREIHIRDYDLKVSRPRHRLAGLARGIHRLLYRCPSCQSLESLAASRPLSTNRVECRSCFCAWKVDIGSRLTPVDENGRPTGRSRTAAELYRQVKAMPLTPIRSNLIRLEKGERLYLASRPHFLYREKIYPRLRLYGFGRAFLTDRRFLFRGRLKKRGRMRFSAPLEEIDSLSIEPGDKLHFMYRKILYRIPIRSESPVKWYDHLERLIAARRGG